MHYKLDEIFLQEYDSFTQQCQVNSWDMKGYHISKKIFNEHSPAEIDKRIDFIWSVLIFSLVIKIIYGYSRPDYKYVNDYFQWRYFGVWTPGKYYKHKFKEMTDLLLPSLEKSAIDYSKKNIPGYVKFFIQCIADLENELVGIDSRSILDKIIEHNDFTEEFSDHPIELSYLFYNELKYQIKNY